MCGIVGYVGGRPARGLLLAGLEKLEYRGYDSAGISVLTETDGGTRLESVRAVGHLSALRDRVAAVGPGANNGGVAVAEAPSTAGGGPPPGAAARPGAGEEAPP